MPEETAAAAESAEETKPTITIAEANAGTEEKPTITIAEANAGGAAPAAAPSEPEDVHYQAVEKEGTVTAIWEMQGQKHVRTIDPRSNEGKQILALFETAG